jgi:hypothetical protein
MLLGPVSRKIKPVLFLVQVMQIAAQSAEIEPTVTSRHPVLPGIVRSHPKRQRVLRRVAIHLIAKPKSAEIRPFVVPQRKLASPKKRLVLADARAMPIVLLQSAVRVRSAEMDDVTGHNRYVKARPCVLCVEFF